MAAETKIESPAVRWLATSSWAIFLIVIATAIASTPFINWPSRAEAVPAFAQQTGQPCEACHVGAFGPQLKPYGRDFKLFGYQSSDGKSHVPPIAVTTQISVTHTAADQNPPPAPHFADNNNVAVDQTSIYYAGKLPMGWGAFAQVTYDGVARAFGMDNTDVRRASDVTLFGKDAIVAIDLNNSPTLEDPWNSTPTWGFPYNGSALAPSGNVSTLIDGGLGNQAIGAGGYVLWNNTLYVDAAAYEPLNWRVASFLGEGGDAGSDHWLGPIPYGRVALIHDWDSAETQTAEIGAYALKARRYPGNDARAGSDTFTDWAIDANYQYIGSGRHVISTHATYIHEDQDLAASSVLSGTLRRNTVTTARADVSYSYADTLTPSAQVFQTNGSYDPALYPVGAKTTGYVLEMAYSPWGKPDSPVSWANARFALQYVGYTEFNGARHNASANNTLYANVWIALAPLGAAVHR